jgi:hypothetical protein
MNTALPNERPQLLISAFYFLLSTFLIFAP